MANYRNLKNAIKSVIKANGNQEITGDILQNALLSIINSLGAGYQFVGIATPETNPGILDQKVFYIANGKGTYTNFGGIEVNEDEVVILTFDDTWKKLATGIVSTEKLSNVMKQMIYDVTVNNNGATFDSLSALLSSANLSTLIPESVRCGGMSIRFINSYNKYMQYHYIGIETTGNPNPFLDKANWKCTDSTIVFESAETKESILPNVLNKWGNIKSLAINSFQGAQEGYVNEYMLEFTVSGDNFTLTLPEGVRWAEESTWENGYTYQVSIVNNLAVFAGWEAQTNE